MIPTKKLNLFPTFWMINECIWQGIYSEQLTLTHCVKLDMRRERRQSSRLVSVESVDTDKIGRTTLLGSDIRGTTAWIILAQTTKINTFLMLPDNVSYKKPSTYAPHLFAGPLHEPHGSRKSSRWTIFPIPNAYSGVQPRMQLVWYVIVLTLQGFDWRAEVYVRVWTIRPYRVHILFV